MTAIDLRLRDGLARGLRAEPTVRLAYLFGSRARGAARPDSDVDVAVLVDDACVTTPTRVKETMWRLVPAMAGDVRSDLIDLVLLNEAPALLRHRVIRDGVLLTARTDAERARFARRTIRDHQDIEPRLRAFTRWRIRRLKEERHEIVDTELLRRRLVALDDYVRRLLRLCRTRESDYVSDSNVRDLAARYLHLAVEAAIDVGNHWNCAAGRRTPESNQDSFVVLQEAGELHPALSKRLQDWAGFRDVLVHDYLTLDHRIVHRKIRRDLGDFDAFRRWALGRLDVG